MVTNNIPNLSMSKELKDSLEKICQYAEEKAKKEGLPNVCKSDIYRMILRLGVEKWLSQKYKKE